MSQTVAETATAAETGEAENDSMEKLQIDEEEDKNGSAEDFLGGRSLMMSDSEDDETPGKQRSPTKKARRSKETNIEEPVASVSEQVEPMEEEEEEENDVERSASKPKKKISAIIDSDSEDEHGESRAADMEVEEKEEELKELKSKPKKKISAIIDSESEEERDADMETKESENSEGKEQEIKKSTKPKSKKKISAIVDSESEEEPTSKESSKAQPKKKLSAIIDTDSEEEQQVLHEEKSSNQKKKSKKQPKEKQQKVDSDEENTSQSSDEGSTQKKLKGIVDSESESERSNADEPMEDQSSAPKDKPNKPMRASAKKALDEMQAIQSEQQRLHREAHISVPYHQPKPRTLKEFLSRRTINTPLELALAGGSPMPTKKEPRRSLALRMNSEELQAYAKLMEERAKEATEFFKPESDHDDDDDEQEEGQEDEPMEMKDNPGVLDVVPEAIELPAEAASEVDVDGTSTVPQLEPTAAEAVGEEVAETEIESVVEPSTETASPTKSVLVTEVVELPKLDLSTLSITPPSKPSTPRISEAIRRLRDEKSSDVSPSLKGDANMVIDLETGDMFAKKPTGVDDLLQRLMKTREAKKHKTTETVNILSTAHGKLELSKVNIHLHEEEPVNKDQKPGAAYIKMQEHLKSLITKKRMEEMRKKKAEEVEEENEEMDVDEEYEPDEKPCKSQVVVNEEEEIVDEEVEEDAEEADEAPDADAACADEEEQEADAAEENAEAVDAENTSSSEAESEPEENTQTGKRKNRIIRAFQDDNSDDDDMDLLQTPKPSTVAPLTATQLQLSAQKLFDVEVERTASDEENELLGLCSGRFTQAESSAAPTDGALISQIPITQAPESSQAPEELEALCSGTFETQPSALPEPATNKILSSDEEPPKQTEEEKPRQKKLTKKRQKKKAKLGFSDDEEEPSSEEEEEEELESDLEEPAEEVPETFVDYDSEENEVVVQMTKKDRKLRAANFVEKEAELSESEWGSADEDEKNMDKYDIELGDEDEFDREKLQHELGQIHARKMLDKDIREVRQIQEMLFEDEEGAVRQRQFRWKNADSAGFSLDDTRNENADADANEGSGDEENEHLWRKIRYEREQLLLEKGLKGDATASPAPLSPAVLNSNTTGGAVRKLTIITAKKTTVEVKKSSPFLISKTVSTTQKQQAVRGSFLVRDKDTLSKLAGLTKAGDVDGTAGTVSVKSAKGKNFVFATLTEEEHESQKRKAADLLNSSNETGINFMKKPRIEPRREKCLIDQLL